MTTDEPLASSSSSDVAPVTNPGVSDDFDTFGNSMAAPSNNGGAQQIVSFSGNSVKGDMYVHNTNIFHSESGSAPGKMPSLQYGLPLSVDKVVARETEVKELHELLMAKGGSKRVVITGMGGVGKTTLAYHCARLWQSQSLIKNIAILNAETTDSFEKSVTNLAAHLKITTENKQFLEIMRDVDNYFNDTDVLLVYDNLVPYEIAYNYLPDSQHMYILATSQITEFSEFFGCYPLECLGPQSGMQLVQHLLSGVNFPTPKDKEIPELVETLGGLPLALQHAAAFIKDAKSLRSKRNYTIKDYVQEFKNVSQEYLSKPFPDNFKSTNKKTVYITLKINIDKISQKTSLDILCCMSFLKPYIYCVLFFNHFGEKSTEAAVRELVKYSLIKCSETDNGDYLEIHRLVQEICRSLSEKHTYIPLTMAILIKSNSLNHYFSTIVQHVDTQSSIIEYTTDGFKNATRPGDLLDRLTLAQLATLELDACVRNDWSVWEWAAYNGSYSILEYLKKNKIEYKHNTSCWTPLHAACLGYVDSITPLFNYLPEHLINQQTRQGLTALHVASATGNAYMIKDLIESGCNNNLRDNEGNTALHLACINTGILTIQTLIYWDTAHDIKNNQGQMALPLYNQECSIKSSDESLIKGFEKIIVFRIISPSGEPLRKTLIKLKMFKDCHGEEHIKQKLEHYESWNKKQETLVTELVEMLQHSYLAIAMITAYIIEEGLTVAGALNMLTENQSHSALERFMNNCDPEALQYKQVFLVICLILDKVKERNVKAFNCLSHMIYLQCFYESPDMHFFHRELLKETDFIKNIRFLMKFQEGDLDACIKFLIKFLLIESRYGLTIVSALVQNIVHAYNSDVAQQITNNVLEWFVCRIDRRSIPVLNIMVVKDIELFFRTKERFEATIQKYEETGCRVTNPEKWSALHMACATVDMWGTIVGRLIKLEVDVNLQVDGIAPIHLASFTRSAYFYFPQLKRAGGDLNVRTNEGWTVLHFATFFNEDDRVCKLGIAGADFHAVTNDGETALDIATRLGHTRIVDMLKHWMNESRR